MAIMRDPVFCSDGHTYERVAITDWFSRGQNTSPLTGAPLPDQNLTPNHALRQGIERYQQQKKQNNMYAWDVEDQS